ncbi:hemicentin-1-like [Pagrus major]|uniref:hemicentin-1-like n=1 Tax=Pagrus major TaxID=143350 RepID=UPI003CC8D61F
MELLPLVCLCLLSCSGETSAAGDGVKVVVEEDDDAVLPCSLSTKEDITGKLFDWKKDGQKEVFMYDSGQHHNNGLSGQDEQFTGRVSHFQDQLKNGNASIKIHKTKMADSGTYSCDFPRLQPRQTFNIELVVGAAPKPNIDILHVTKDGILLQCEAHGDPLPTVEWKDSAGKTLPADERQVSEKGGHSYITVNITVTKTGRYHCVAKQKEINHQISAETSVYIQGVRVVVEEDSDAVLPCSLSTKEDITAKTFEWRKDGQKEVFFYISGIFTSQDEQFTGRVSHFQDQLKNSNASIKITKTKKEDSGNYSCIFPNLQPRQTFYIELVVGQVLRDRTGEYIPGAAPKPIINILDDTKDGILLQCEAHGDPPLTVEWKDRADNTLPADERQVSERGGHSYITVNITVTKTGRYRCVATQKNISHEISAETFVYFQDPPPEPGVRVKVEEDDDAVLPCSLSTKEDITAKTFEWKKDERRHKVFFYNSGIFTSQDQQFTGRVSHFQDQLKNGNASIKITKTTKADSGTYSCIFPNLQPRQTFIIELVVGAAPKPIINILDDTKDGILLQCEARGVPPLTVEWKDRAGKTLHADERQESERGGRSYITVNITVTKTDTYRCVATQKNISHEISAETYVYIQGVRVKVEEDDDAVLPCSLSTKEDITAKTFEWKKDERRHKVFFYNSGIFTSQDQQFKGRVSHFQDQLKNGNASIKITKTEMADSGTYSCIFPNLQLRQTFIIELVVGQVLRDIPGLAPRPYIDILDDTKDGILLQCEARGVPPLTVEWKDRAGNTLHADERRESERGGHSYIAVNITVTKTGRYRCVAVQKEISHEISAETFVYIQGAATQPGSSAGWVTLWFLVFLLLF